LLKEKNEGDRVFQTFFLPPKTARGSKDSKTYDKLKSDTALNLDWF
jgi:hypothetical protein